MNVLDVLGINKYKGLLNKLKEARIYKEDGVLKAHVKMNDDTEFTSPLTNYKAIVDAIARSKDVDTEVKAKK